MVSHLLRRYSYYLDASAGILHSLCGSGFVNQSDELKPFRWGIGRLIAEAKTPPLLLPFYHTGLQRAVPESRKIKVPFPGHKSYCHFGEVFDSAPLIAESLAMDRPKAYSFLTKQVYSKTDALRIQTLDKIKRLD
jgi:monolysocardiolipin acyltransferase